ncbi:putative pantetheine-phosphate adenylyltransferase NDAI_0B00600 [Naumovozyma dairenensis CBS 421]|uniref:Cytidyltransferase-like domain-containing protein n=1 Tax=Naumovozyma dairenensis (strain ATCC 10597 / BCRC 20456 / CBS 421 / NBRC 0211 / NRRL Y-12639) TaxID=1071378 RepID=G0W5N3_NAUDC|nr:hypothetical protein NDAI_0B00600 [Naumovozyma dairenensis CBS 421]CCD23094.1 hypothetical protein NDAI_0B00600 [Naumovozyma dairenensis CBS 421]
MRVGVIFDWFGKPDYNEFENILRNCLKNVRFGEQTQITTNADALDIVLVHDKESLISSIYLDKILGKLYSIARDILLEHEYFLLPINVLFDGSDYDNIQWDIMFMNTHEFSLIEKDKFHYRESQTFEQRNMGSRNGTGSSMDDQTINDKNEYKVTALGGTFDHIHDGHKILLTMAAFLTSDRLIVGVTDEELLVNKKYKEQLENFDKRCLNVMTFVHLVKPSLRVEIVPIKDVCGPTGTVPEIEALVVSRETIAGGQVVNDTRQQRKMHPLAIHVVNVLGGNEEDGWREKLSSTEVRKLISEHRE